MTCPVTGQPLPDGYVLHPDLKPELENVWYAIAQLMPELEATLAKQTAPVDTIAIRTPPGSAPPININILEITDEIRDAFFAWSFALSDHLHTVRPPFYAASWRGIAAYHIRYLDEILRWDEAGTYWDETTYTLKRVERIFNPAPKRQYTKCGCGTDNYAPPAATETQCTECDTLIHIETQNATLWEKAIYQWWPKKDTLKIVHATTGHQLKETTLKNWQHRGHITRNTNNRYQPNQIIQQLKKRTKK